MSESTQANPRRVLAAIVFTDVVGFSQLMSVNDTKTLKLTQRDFAMMRRLSESHEGQILKNTGDGLLMYFSSAVQAVSCALKIQQTLANAETKLPSDQMLKHRIGIHLGDVFLSENDVMGDGVNIASRLQAKAEPGGICISQTVYDVVKNRLELQTTFLGPQELRNIQGKVPVYRILLDAQGGRGAAGLFARGAAAASSRRWVIATAVAAALIILAAVWIGYRISSGNRAQSNNQAVASGNPATPAQPTPAPSAQPTTPTQPTPGVPQATLPVVPPTGQPAPTAQDPQPAPPAQPLQPPQQPEVPQQPPPGPAGPDDGEQPQQPPPAERIFETLDRNRDGKLTRDEIPRREVDRMMQADTDGDGAVTLAELRAMHEKMRTGRFRPRPGLGQGPAGPPEGGPPPGSGPPNDGPPADGN
ncbi:MAG: hypothetical protein BIFFINMI_00765 [Phycisphaerae bacterium]|nr:hypothetical protein [Phycisphaerae bacterium]